MNDSLARAIAVLVLVTAVESAGLTWVWNNVVTVAFGTNELAFGQMFMMVLALRVFFRDLWKLSSIIEILRDIRAVQLFEAQNAAHRAEQERERAAELDKSDK